MRSEYESFLQSKIPRAELGGFEPPSPPHESLFPHQVDIAKWAVRGGRRAVFKAFGLGKTRTNLQVAKWVIEHSDKAGMQGKYLIVAPLGVRQEFTKVEGPAMGMEIAYCRDDAEVAAASTPFIITNYERVRDGQITVDPVVFVGAGLDEASVLRSYGSKTYQTFLDLFKSIRYRFVFTATPSPNRHKELIHYGGFLGVMDTGEALTRFFKRDAKKAGNLTLHPHMEERFWLWLSTWAVFMQRPSDLGYSDEGYDLPEMQIHWHKVDVDHSKAWKQEDAHGQKQLILDHSSGVKELAEVKRETMVSRVLAATEIMGGEWQKESAEIEAQLEEAKNLIRFEKTIRIPTLQRKLRIGYTRASRLMEILQARRVVGPKQGVEHPVLEETAQLPLVPQDAHWIVWHDLEAERELIEDMIPGARTVYGSQDLEKREDLILGFARGEYRILATKPSLAGSGCNFQRHCSRAIFLGSTYKFNDFIQAVHRIQRFQQKEKVHIHVIYAESEEPVINTLKDKWRQHNELVAKMTDLLRKFRLQAIDDMNLKRDFGCERLEVEGKNFRAINNDCVLELESHPSNSVDQIVTSIPFGNQYEYTPSYNDFGHNLSNTEFFEQMDFLVPHLHRVLKPGRMACIHVKDRIRFGNVTGLGMPTVDRFSDKTAAAFEKYGFAFCGRITIDTDVVRENAQTYRLGWTENAKDSTKMGVGMPEYVLLLRKLPTDLSNSYADERVTKDKAVYTRADWQLDAAGFWKSDGNRLPDPELLATMKHDQLGRLWKEHCRKHRYEFREHVELCRALESADRLPADFMLFPPVSNHPDVWTDIIRVNTLNSEQAKRNEENHVCPLQIDIIERLINRYSNPGELILDPFGGIMSVGYVAIRMMRRAIMIELCKSYWRSGVGYCEMAEAERDVPTLFDMADFGLPVIAA